MKPFFSYFGSKWRAAPRYPAPACRRIVEPFAGSAGYATRYPSHDVVLVERDPTVAALWRWLIRVPAAEILALPDLRIGASLVECQSVDNLDVRPEAKTLIGFWLNAASVQPHKRYSAWARTAVTGKPKTGGAMLSWGPRVRARLAEQVERIRHWTLIEGDYRQAPEGEATWFIDPPYEIAGRIYRHGSKEIDYQALGDWCRSRVGQVIVCENVGATWLPFRPWRCWDGIMAKRTGKKSDEALWVSPLSKGQLELL